MLTDELLEMSRRMKERLEELQRDQERVTEKLARRVDDMKEVLSAAGEALKV